MTSCKIHVLFKIAFFASIISSSPPLSEKFIKLINSRQLPWIAGINFLPSANFTIIRRLAGTIMSDHNYKVIASTNITQTPDLPQDFDARKKWHKCQSLHEIRNQGGCGSCWALAAVSAMTDRYCIQSGYRHKYNFSAGDMSTCCISNGCARGGYISYAWQYWQYFGVVTGGDYKSNEGCVSYLIPPCTKLGCGNVTVMMPHCIHQCRSGFYRSYKKDKRFGRIVYAIKGGEGQMKAEIFAHGPVEAAFLMYTDFLSYKSGVYKHTTGELLGGHAVKIIGWGTENGYKYWLAANSWGTEWGENGFFKIIRGENHCKIESLVMAGKPDIKSLRSKIKFNIFDNIQVELQW